MLYVLHSTFAVGYPKCKHDYDLRRAHYRHYKRGGITGAL